LAQASLPDPTPLPPISGGAHGGSAGGAGAGDKPWWMDLLAQLSADGLLNEDAASLLDGEDGPGNRSVVLVGVTGDGKSSTGNTLVGADVFAVDGGFKSVTQECSQADYIHAGGFWRVIDTIGLQDTGLSQKEVLDRFSTFAAKTPAGIDAFLFIVRWGRFKPEHDAALSSFLANCGEEVLLHTILVFTHCTEPHEAVQRALAENAPESLRAWLPRLRGGAALPQAPRRGPTARAGRRHCKPPQQIRGRP